MAYSKIITHISKLVLGVCFVFSSSVLKAEETKINDKVTGIWFGAGEDDFWAYKSKASWIWLDEKLNEKTLLARKTFINATPGGKALLEITASSQYQLYVNGKYVCRGPARCAPHHQSYDILDISRLLVSGENIIAVRVHHQDGKRSYQYEERAGLYALLTISYGSTVMIMGSDSTWKVTADPSWDNNAPLISRFQQVVNDRVDFRKYLKGWETLDYDDSQWENANELIRKHGWPAHQKNAGGQYLVSPWTSLVPRDIPYLLEQNIVAEKLIEAVQISTPITDKPHTLSGKIDIKQPKNGILEVPDSGSSSWLLIYDFGEVINGMPQLEIKGNAGTEIEIVTAPFMVDNKFTHITVDSEFRDKIILSGEHDKWESTYFKPTRYLGIIVRNEAPVYVNSVGIRQIKYPFEKKGNMSSKDAPWVKKYFDATAKTINVCTTDAYTDNYRERRQYAQTNYYAALGNYFIFGDLALQRRYLIQVAQEQLANGIMPAYAPLAKDDYMVILDSNCLWIRGLKNYLMYSGDEETVRSLLPAAQKLMELLHSFTQSLYFIDNPPYAYWLDHSLNDRRGANLCLNGHYYGALKDYVEILRHLNMETKEWDYQVEAAGLSFIHYWNDEKQLFTDALIDGKPSIMYSEHGNAMAMAVNDVWKEEAKQAAQTLLADDKHDFIKRESGVTMVTPAMSYFFHKGLCECGYIKESFELFRKRFDKMLDENTNQTLWEEWWLDGTGRTGKFQGGRTRSDAQTESAFPPALFAEYLLGIRVVEPGMKKISIRFTNSGLKDIDGKIPTPLGILELKWLVSGSSGSLILDIPEGMIVIIDRKSLEVFENTIEIENVEINETLESGNLELHNGKYKLSF